MIKHIQGDILSTPSGVVVHGCNAQGVMGSGVAKALRDKHPSCFRVYREAYESQGNKLHLGDIHPSQVSDTLHIVNGITQMYYGRTPGRVYVDYDAVASVMRKSGALAKELGLPLVFPLIGCGLAGGDWARVSKIIEDACPDVEKILYTIEPLPMSHPRPRL
jgi:O-acetyl-ADP-ribose deacetylase (regulator of RNase III)